MSLMSFRYTLGHIMSDRIGAFHHRRKSVLDNGKFNHISSLNSTALPVPVIVLIVGFVPQQEIPKCCFLRPVRDSEMLLHTLKSLCAVTARGSGAQGFRNGIDFAAS